MPSSKSTLIFSFEIMIKIQSLDYQDDISERFVICGSDLFNISAFPDSEEVPGDEVEEDVGHDGGGVSDCCQARSLVRAFGLE